jgi:hypothetical protein
VEARAKKELWMGIPYQAIGIGLGFLLGVYAFIIADSVTGRVFIAATMVAICVLRVVWQSAAASLVSFICWIVFGLGCYVFLKYRGVGFP